MVVLLLAVGFAVLALLAVPALVPPVLQQPALGRERPALGREPPVQVLALVLALALVLVDMVEGVGAGFALHVLKVLELVEEMASEMRALAGLGPA